MKNSNPVTATRILQRLKTSSSDTSTYLDRAIWRYRMGWYDTTKMSSILKLEIERLANEYSEYRDVRGMLREFYFHHLVEYEECFHQILISHENMQYERTTDKIKEANLLLQKLRDTHSVILLFRKTKKQLEMVKELIGKTLFDESPFFSMIYRLMTKCEIRIKDAQPQKARLVLSIINDELCGIDQSIKNEEESYILSSKLIYIEKVLTSIDHKGSIQNSNTLDKSRFKKLKTLITNSRLTLANILIKELEKANSCKLTFSNESTRFLEAFGDHQNEEVRLLANSNSLDSPSYWDNITRKYIEKSLTLSNDKLSKINDELKLYLKTS